MLRVLSRRREIKNKEEREEEWNGGREEEITDKRCT